MSLAVSKHIEETEDVEINNNCYYNNNNDNSEEISLKEEPISDLVDLNELENNKHLNMFSALHVMTFPKNSLPSISSEHGLYKKNNSELVISSPALVFNSNLTTIQSNNVLTVDMHGKTELNQDMHGIIGSNPVMDDQSLAAAEALTQLAEIPRLKQTLIIITTLTKIQ